MTTALAWAPSPTVFMRRAVINGVATFVIFVLLCWLSGLSEGRFLMLGLGLPFVLTLILLLEDLLRWRSVHSENWEVAEGHLMHDGPDGRAMIPLGDIDTVMQRFGNVVIRLMSGKRVMMRYLPEPADVVAQLDNARPQ